ncbi:hypothetical protein F4776DRAFT_321043 [Hypoxylon sp. NC0597]|nr:hypothetical protein F4776DRAFT_321043 [Hypoxylon sp. NC0597]
MSLQGPIFQACYQALEQVVLKLEADECFKKASHALRKTMKESAEAEVVGIYSAPGSDRMSLDQVSTTVVEGTIKKYGASLSDNNPTSTTDNGDVPREDDDEISSQVDENLPFEDVRKVIFYAEESMQVLGNLAKDGSKNEKAALKKAGEHLKCVRDILKNLEQSD